MFGLALVFARKSSIQSYFLNKRKTTLWILIFANVATIIGAGATVAIVTEVYRSGISYGIALPIALVTGVIILGIVAKKIKEVGDKYQAYTIVDFFHKRFGARNKTLTEILQIFLLIGWIAVQAIAIASLATVLVGIDYKLALFLTAAVTIVYTSIGGLKIDIITDFVQFWIIFIMFIILTVVGFNHVGGISSLISQLPLGHLDPFAFGGITWFLGMIFLSGFLFLGNTTHWQRIFSSNSVKTARRSFFLSIPFMVILTLLILFVGMVAAVSLPGVTAESSLFLLMKKLLPPVLIGLGFAAILAVIMSSIDSLLIGGSTIIYKRVYGEEFSGRSKKKILIAKGITALFGVFGFLIAFLVPNIITLSLLVSYLALVFVPAVIAGLYSKKISGKASFFSILISAIALFIAFPFLKENSFIVSSVLSILIIIFYDRIFRRGKSKGD